MQKGGLNIDPINYSDIFQLKACNKPATFLYKIISLNARKTKAYTRLLNSCENILNYLTISILTKN